MHAANGQQLSGADRAMHSFIQIVQDDGDWFEPRDIVKLVLKARQPKVSHLVKSKRGRYQVEACAPSVAGEGRCLEVLLREIRSA